jgi:hypothetical protein
MGFHIIMPLTHKMDIMVFYSMRASSNYVPCNKDKWFWKWGCCSIGIKIFFSIYNPWTNIKSDFNFLLCIYNTNTIFTTIQSFPLYIWSGSHVQAKHFPYRIHIVSGPSRRPFGEVGQYHRTVRCSTLFTYTIFSI